MEQFWSHWAHGTGHERQFSELTHGSLVNASDFSALSFRWLDTDCHQNNNYCVSADINRDGQVDVEDLMLFFNNWLTPQ
ncbi:MAG: hypothetical protein ACYSUT_04380 [Planctomycetota bacterium]|jgi:hypothetical protein